MRAALLLLTAMLPIAGGLARAHDALRGPRPHICVCPLDSDGHCLCPECIRLGIHDRHDREGDHGSDHESGHEGDHDEPALRVDPGPVLASACAPGPDEDPPPLALERAILPPIDRVLAPAAHAALEHSLAPPLCARAAEPAVPPPRLG